MGLPFLKFFIRNNTNKIIMQSPNILSSRSAKSNSSVTKKISLRTLFKCRANKKNTQNVEQSTFLTNNYPQQQGSIPKTKRLNKSAQIQKISQLSYRSSFTPSISQNTMRKIQTLNCEEQLVQKKQPQHAYKEMMEQLDELDSQVEALVRGKITKMLKKSSILTLKDKGQDEISAQIQNLIKKVSEINSGKLEKIGCTEKQIKTFSDRKIRMLQKLMAEKTIQSDVLKKHYFAISAITHKSKTVKNIRRFMQQTKKQLKKKPLINPLKQCSKTQQSISKQSINHLSFNAPKPIDYQTFRHQNKKYVANMQPLPRSSYNCQYLRQAPFIPPYLCKNADQMGSLRYSKLKLQSSTYSQDYKSSKAKLTNFRQLDCYRNKLKKIEVSYAIDNLVKKEQQQKYIQKNRRYLTEQMTTKSNINNSRIIKSQTESIIQDDRKSKNSKMVLFNTQSKRNFMGEQQIYNSNIKHRDLFNLRYQYRSLTNK